VSVNVVAFCVMGYDKQASMAGAGRVPELVLGTWALAGGTLGTFAGMQCFRHKTQKSRFHMIVAVVLMMQILAVHHYREMMGIKSLKELVLAQSNRGKVG
jgi:uncharacterized membrane protein YsdA (DUF1294 family)